MGEKKRKKRPTVTLHAGVNAAVAKKWKAICGRRDRTAYKMLGRMVTLYTMLEKDAQDAVYDITREIDGDLVQGFRRAVDRAVSARIMSFLPQTEEVIQEWLRIAKSAGLPPEGAADDKPNKLSSLQ